MYYIHHFICHCTLVNSLILFPFFTTGVIDTGGKFTPSAIETCGKFATGVIDTGGAPLSPILTNICEKFSKMTPILFSGALGKMIHEKSEAKNLVILSL
jgi:hypothetical protein